MQLHPHERIQQLHLVPVVRCRERDGESGPDHSFRECMALDVPVAIQSQVPTIRTVQKTVEVLLQLQSLIER